MHHAATAGVSGVRPAVRGIAETVGNLQFFIKREQQRQAQRLSRVNILFPAGIAPAAAQPFVAFAVRAHDHGGGVVHEAPEGFAAEGGVFAGVEDEVVPDLVGGLRGHGHIAAALLVRQEELAQGAGGELAVLGLQVRVFAGEAGEQAGGQAAGADVVGAGGPQPLPPEEEAQQGEQQGEEDSRHDVCSGGVLRWGDYALLVVVSQMFGGRMGRRGALRAPSGPNTAFAVNVSCPKPASCLAELLCATVSALAIQSTMSSEVHLFDKGAQVL